MIRPCEYTWKLPPEIGDLNLSIKPVGEDVLAVISGGHRPHIGCAVLAVPRPSLTGKGQSCTSSVLNCTGHKDEFLCRLAAECLCKHYGVTVLCTGGFHSDNLTGNQIRLIQESMTSLLESVCKSKA